MHTTVSDAFEIFGPSGEGPFFITCEHASPRVPTPLRATPEDKAWLRTHWGYDIGARTVSRELIRLSRARGIFSRFSRLVCDANRAPNHPDLIREHIGTHALGFNGALSPAERTRRIETYHAPYHAAIDAELRAHTSQRLGEVLLLSLHSFTPVWDDKVRPMDIGVLFSTHEAIAHRLARELSAEGFQTAMNEPYSGREGLIYAAARHGQNHRVVFLELEVNQALLGTPVAARRVAQRVAAAMMRLRLRGRA